MSLHINCTICDQELDEQGSLYLGPPNVECNEVEKLHICRPCHADVGRVIADLRLAAQPPVEARAVMPRVGGKPFRCACGANVFSTTDDVHFSCNGCSTEYQSIPLVRPECADHPLDEHDGPANPDGCGHCPECHSDDPDAPRCGHWIGCPGC